MKRMDSRFPRIAGFPYNAQAIASRIVVLPAPLGPMIPVRPDPNVISVCAC